MRVVARCMLMCGLEKKFWYVMRVANHAMG